MKNVIFFDFNNNKIRHSTEFRKCSEQCTTCRHFINKGLEWFDQFCNAGIKEKRLDPKTRIKKYIYYNDAGNIIYDDYPYKRCSDIHQGNPCSLFVERRIDILRKLIFG